MKGKTHDLNHDLTINCVCHSIRSMFRVLVLYNFGVAYNNDGSKLVSVSEDKSIHLYNIPVWKRIAYYSKAILWRKKGQEPVLENKNIHLYNKPVWSKTNTEFDINISDWRYDCTDHKNGFDFFMRLVKWPKIAVKKCQNLIFKVNFQRQKISESF